MKDTQDVAPDVVHTLGRQTLGPASRLKESLESRPRYHVDWVRLPLMPGETEAASFETWMTRLHRLGELYEPVVEGMLGGCDLLISDPAVFAAACLYPRRRIPWVQLGNLPIFWPSQVPILQATVPEMEPDVAPSAKVVFVGPLVPRPGYRELPLPLWMHEDRRPKVYVSQGTIDQDHSKLILPTLAGMESQRSICTFQGQWNHYALMECVDCFVTNGGYGGVAAAIRCGVPMVVAGETQDHPMIADRVERAGLGINLRTGRPTEIKHIECVLETIIDFIGNSVMIDEC